jgi:neutral ceramidase
MNMIKFLRLLIILASLLPHMATAQKKSKKPDMVHMGVARINITPEKPTMMSGYAARTTPFTGVNDSIYASAFYFTVENTRALLINADLIGFSFGLVDEMKNLISSKTGVLPQNIMLVAAHNHGGPSLGDYSDMVKEYTARLKEKLVSVSVAATSRPVPVRMGVGKGYCNMNINRRAEFTKGEVWLGRNPGGISDHELDVIKFETMDGTPLAVLVNWPCHATTTGDSNYLITGDWPGAVARHIRKQLGEGVVVGVTAGASGDINPIYGPGNVFREVEAIGFHVGHEATRVMEQMVTYPVKTLQVTDTLLTFPGKTPSKNHFPQSSFEPGPDTNIRLSAFKIGGAVLAGISGEVMTEIGMEIKKLSPYSNTVLMTHCNGSSGYICTDKSYSEGGYEIQVTRLMPGAEKPLIRTFIGLIYSLDK